jgi:hypothetical protein
MLRYTFALVLVLAIAALLTHGPAARRSLWVVVALVILCAVLKLTGVIEVLAPDRIGVL